MKFENTFNVIARCRIYEKGDTENYHTDDIVLHFNKEKAMCFLFRFSPYAFSIDNFKVIFHMDGTSVDGLQLVDNDNIYIVTNLNQLFIEVHEGYFNILAFEKINNILTFDFNTNYSSEDIEDEFGDKEGNED
jgi:hypothetical protein